MIKAIDGRKAGPKESSTRPMTDCTCVCETKTDKASVSLSVFADPNG